MIKRKRGVTTVLEAVIDILVALICIVILFYVFSAVYGLFFGGKEKPYAEAQLKEIVDAISYAKASGEKTGFLLSTPSSWFFVSFSNGENENAISPLLCKNADCIAICPKPLTETAKLWWGKIDCKKGVYKVIDKQLLKDSKPVFMKIEIKDMCIKSDSTYSLTEEKCKEAWTKTQITNENIETSTLTSIIEYAQTNAIGGKVYGNPRTCNCATTCTNYAEIIKTNSDNYRVDSLLTFAIMLQESSCNADAQTSTNCGLMQVPCKTENWQNPQTNIISGIEILKQKYAAFLNEPEIGKECGEGYYFPDDPWRRAIRGYRGYFSDCRDKDYVFEVLERYNQLKELKNQNQGTVK